MSQVYKKTPMLASDDPSTPMVSIVMPSFNQGSFIEASVKSVLTQTWGKLELIVADGGSTDRTQSILEQIQKTDPRLKWHSEKDAGPAHALNKALSLCKGTIIGWLNSDDLYTNDAVKRAALHLNEHPDLLMVYGQGEHITEDGRYIERYPTRTPDTPIQTFSNGCFICQPTVFFRRSMYLLLGKLDQNLKTAFDFEYWLRAFSAFPTRIGFVDTVQAQSRLHSACITQRMRETAVLEGMEVLARHLGTAPAHWLQGYIRDFLAQTAAQPDDANQKAKISAMIDTASKWLDQTEQKKLRHLLAGKA